MIKVIDIYGNELGVLGKDPSKTEYKGPILIKIDRDEAIQFDSKEMALEYLAMRLDSVREAIKDLETFNFQFTYC